MDLIEQVRQTIEKFHMLERGDRVLVAVSGGPDSVALLHLLWRLEDVLGIHLHVGHLDHGLRGSSSRGDAQYTRRLARRLELPVTLGRIQLSPGSTGNLEEQARLARYAFLEKVADQIKAQRIATGHQADDQAETILMRILRGAGSAGLSGIPPVRGRIVRPCIQLRRNQIEEYLRRFRLRPRRDDTNLEHHYLRNQIRRELIPLLERSYNPNIIETLNRIGRLESEESAFFEQMSQKLLERLAKKGCNGKIVLDLRSFADYFSIEGKFLIRELIRRTKGDLRRIGFGHLEQVLRLGREGSVGSRVHLPDGIVVERCGQSLIFTKDLPQPFCETVQLPGKNELSSAGWCLTAELVTKSGIPWPPKVRDGYEAFMDWAQVQGPFELRTRRRGDRFRPLGMRGTRKLSDFLIDRKVPRIQRDEVPLLVGRDGIFWIVGHAIADPYKVTDSTRAVLWARCFRRETA
jgi:tRNA(Ile)-lysidine synthase